MSENLKKLRPSIEQVPQLALYWQTLAFLQLKNETTKDSNRAQSDRAQKQPQIQMDSPSLFPVVDQVLIANGWLMVMMGDEQQIATPSMQCVICIEKKF